MSNRTLSAQKLSTKVYNSTKTISPLSDQYWSSVTMLLKASGSSAVDATGRHTSFAGSYTTSTSTKKYNAASLSFSSTYLTVGDGASDFAFNSDFTVEMWIYPTSVSGARMIYDGRPLSTNGAQPIFFLSDGTMVYQDNSGNFTGSGTVSANQWSHVAMCRSGTTIRLFLNGVLQGSATKSTNITNTTGRPMIGGDGASNSGNWAGFMDEIRVTQGVARYTAAFTPPTAAMPTAA